MIQIMTRMPYATKMCFLSSAIFIIVRLFYYCILVEYHTCNLSLPCLIPQTLMVFLSLLLCLQKDVPNVLEQKTDKINYLPLFPPQRYASVFPLPLATITPSIPVPSSLLPPLVFLPYYFSYPLCSGSSQSQKNIILSILKNGPQTPLASSTTTVSRPLFKPISAQCTSLKNILKVFWKNVFLDKAHNQ